MVYKIIETEHAQRDLSDIVDYIVSALENPSAAVSLLDEVAACYDNLERLPMMFEACRDPRLKSMGYRKARIKNYIMIYKVNESRRAVLVMRFFHGRQDYEKLL